jgi:hypothetical protein
VKKLHALGPVVVTEFFNELGQQHGIEENVEEAIASVLERHARWSTVSHSGRAGP